MTTILLLIALLFGAFILIVITGKAVVHGAAVRGTAWPQLIGAIVLVAVAVTGLGWV